MSYTITRVGSNIVLKFGSDIHYMWQIGKFSTKIRNDNLVKMGNNEFEIQLDYTLCTSPSGSTSKYDLISKISELTDRNSNTDYGYVDSGNSTTTPLSADAVFTGNWFDCTNFSEFTCLVSTDVSGTLNMDSSTDGVNIDRSKSVVMSSGGVHTLIVVSKYMRIKFTNDSTNQGYLRLQTMFHKFKSKDLTSTVSEIICDVNDVSLVRNVNDPLLDLARNIHLDKHASLIFGRNETVGTSSEDIWIVGGDYNFLTGATTFEIVSNSAEDDATGLGARSVLINGLDSNLNELSEVVAITGSGTVTTVNSYWRLHSAYVATCGTNRGSNYNNIDIQSTGGNLLIGRIAGGYGTINTANYGIGRTQLGIVTVPAAHTLYITSMYVNVDNSKTANVSLYCISNIDNVTPPVAPRVLLAQIDGMTDFREKRLMSYFAIPEKSDIWFRASLNSGAAGIDIQFEYFLIHD